MIQRITLAEVEEITFSLAKTLMDWHEPIPDFGSRYPERLESCLETPFQTFNRQDLYSSFVNKVSIFFYLMNKNHPFENGNKRLAVTTLLVLLFKNEQWLSVSVMELYEFAKEVAASKPEAKDATVTRINSFITQSLTDLE